MATVLIFSVAYFASFSKDRHLLWGSLFGSHDYVVTAAVALALPFSCVGIIELIRGGRYFRKDRRILEAFSFVLFILCDIALFHSNWHRGLEIPFSGLIAAFVSPFLVARYLNHRQCSFASLPTVTHAR